ncbi:WecB/TagA/CpsF family glycosyltransferase [Shewanella sp. 202IG2-18]|uniref:WecB/TagA/CpsF family glycosyltransferase n=1 Tax=Parashewanella hymeniacidonis TaxID=2807618 RepID=UPI0019613339|nr:WecB/TagA/CpsF family glycosyltransferase [Parashewanella hymeniacidonis]MBM7072035.1 WecB/TagA/CpsF family glycosyltransferase [Parashewanella hymeniacidonis]
MEVFDFKDFREIVNNADLVVPDGKPLVWGQKLLGNSKAHQIRGQDLTFETCRLAEKENLSVGFYGASQETLDAMNIKLTSHYPKLNIVYSYSPPFRQLNKEEKKLLVDNLNNSGIDILFVGLGCPKQEKWMAEHKKCLKCVMLGVGAAFDFIAGNKKHAPKWMQSVGLEWLFRLLCEPTRLWKRYLKQNPRFVWYFIQQLLGKKFK